MFPRFGIAAFRCNSTGAGTSTQVALSKRSLTIENPCVKRFCTNKPIATGGASPFSCDVSRPATVRYWDSLCFAETRNKLIPNGIQVHAEPFCTNKPNPRRSPYTVKNRRSRYGYQTENKLQTTQSPGIRATRAEMQLYSSLSTSTSESPAPKLALSAHERSLFSTKVTAARTPSCPM